MTYPRDGKSLAYANLDSELRAKKLRWAATIGGISARKSFVLGPLRSRKNMPAFEHMRTSLNISSSSRAFKRS